MQLFKKGESWKVFWSVFRVSVSAFGQTGLMRVVPAHDREVRIRCFVMVPPNSIYSMILLCIPKNWCHGFMIYGYQYSTSQHHAVYWEFKSKCFSSGFLSGREEELRSPGAFSSTVIIPAQGNRYKGAGHLTHPSSRLAVFPVGSACYCCSWLHARLQY